MEKEIYDILCDNVLEKIQEKSVTYIFQKVSDCGEVKKEHSLVMTRFLKEACYELLEEKGEIYRLIWTMGPELRQKAAEYDIIEFTGRLDDIRGKLDQNRRKLFASRAITPRMQSAANAPPAPPKARLLFTLIWLNGAVGTSISSSILNWISPSTNRAVSG